MTKKSSDIRIRVSPGELIDKLTILEIKKAKIKDKEKLSAVKYELDALTGSMKSMIKNAPELEAQLAELKKKLTSVNRKLWNIEDIIRKLDAKKDFGPRFTEKARSVYITNDKRSEIKRKINLLFGSKITEVKQYTNYRTSKNKRG